MASTRQRGSRYVGLYRDASGKQKSAGTYADQEEALAHAVLAEREANPPAMAVVYRPEKHGVPTIAAYVPLALAGAKLEATSRETYGYLSKHVVKEFGAKALDEITPPEVRMFARKLDAKVQAGEMASSTSVHVFGVLKLVYATAVQDFPAIANPCTGTSVQRKGSAEKIIATREQADRVIAALPAIYTLLGELLFATGLRFGEALALKASDVVQKPSGRYVIKVRRSIAEVGGRHVERRHGKTDCATRDVPVSEALALKLIEQGNGRPDGRCFVTSRGTFPLRSNFSRTWGTACRKGGIPGATPHSARHSFCSWLANNPGISLARVSRIMGHSSLTQTSAYIHDPDDEDDSILAALAA